MIRSASYRDIVGIKYDGVPHPAVVLRCVGQMAVVLISGTGTLRPHYPSLSVLRDSSYAKTMRLTKNTYFYQSGLKVVALADLVAWDDGNRKAPPKLAAELLDFAREQLAQARGDDAQTIGQALEHSPA